jgi:hypothetical protein
MDINEAIFIHNGDNGGKEKDVERGSRNIDTPVPLKGVLKGILKGVKIEKGIYDTYIYIYIYIHIYIYIYSWWRHTYVTLCVSIYMNIYICVYIGTKGSKKSADSLENFSCILFKHIYILLIKYFYLYTYE